MQALKNLLHHHHPPPPVPFTLPALPPPSSPPAVPHTHQNAEWDCGLACLHSLLAYHHIPTTLPYLRSLLTTDSIWTVDLLALLSHYHLRAILYTTYSGANPSHSNKQFYSPAWHEDTARITHLFQLYDTPAGSGGVRVDRRSLPADTVYEWVERGSVVLLLVDPRYLHCPHCHTHQSLTLASHFYGHFILLTRIEHRTTTTQQSTLGGYGRRSSGVERGEVDSVRLVWYMDPASDTCAECVCSEIWMERARKSDGTDEDCIVIVSSDQPTTATATTATAATATVADNTAAAAGVIGTDAQQLAVHT